MARFQREAEVLASLNHLVFPAGTLYAATGSRNPTRLHSTANGDRLNAEGFR
jgi:hypothetical protein